MAAFTGTFKAKETRPAPKPAATGATAGTPGSWTPGGSTPPYQLPITGVTATPATAWTTGQHVVTGDAAKVRWNGTAWVAAPAGTTLAAEDEAEVEPEVEAEVESADESAAESLPRSDWTVPRLDEWAADHPHIAPEYPFDANKPEKLAYLNSVEGD